MRWTWLLIAAIALAACQRSESPTPAVEPAPSRPTFVAGAADGDIADVVRGQLARAKASGNHVLVYVSAAWCEPCQRFQEAIVAGELDGVFPPLELVKFDYDRDEERLALAGYGSTMIPLFVVPSANGRASDHRLEGSIKGPTAVHDNLKPRLLELLEHPID